MLRQFKTVSKTALPSMFSSRKKEVFRRLLEQATGYFEYGCGGSTAIANGMSNLLRITSVETDYEWAKRVHEVCPDVNMIWVDIGPTKEFGQPVDETLRIGWPRVPEVWTQASQTYDLVLIDGRFRVACAALICLFPNHVKRICFDDFTSRPHYHAILPFIDILETVDTMIVCQPKADLDRDALQQIYERYKYDPA
jgi:protein O-GlcNAc transferase